MEKNKNTPEQQPDLFAPVDGEDVIEFDELNDLEDEAPEEEQQQEESKPSRAEKRIRELVAKNKENEKKIAEYEKKLKDTETSTKKQVSSLELSSAEKDLNSATARVEEAKRAFRDAYSSGDEDKMVEAQVAIADAVDLKNSIQVWVDHLKNTETQEKDAAPEKEAEAKPVKQLTSREKRWLSSNDWFKKDPVMTMTVQGIHLQLLNSGYAPDDMDDAEFGHEAYWNEVDNQMSKLFPEKYNKVTSSSKSAPPVNAPSTSPNAGKPGSGKKTVRLTEEQRAMAARLGISPERYAQELVKKKGRGE